MKRVSTVINGVNLVDEFRKMRGQMTQSQSDVTPVERKHTKTTRNKRTNSRGSKYENFLVKYENLEDYIDSFKTRDLCYYFKKVAEDSDYKYVISNIQKDMHIFKRLQESYDNREICGMIEFLYNSDQDYLDKERLSPNILASRWINTVYADFKLWLDDKYIPKAKRKHSNKEWTAPVEETSTRIGEW